MSGTQKEKEQSAVILLEDICYAYGEYIALDHISLRIKRGEAVALQGPNGCGKSTLLALLNGLIFPEKGRYLFDGEAVTKRTMKDPSFAKRLHQRMGFIFQNADVQLFCASVEEEIAFGPAQMGLSEAEVTKRTEDVIGLLNLKGLRMRAPYHLSGGEKRKVAIACVLSMNPEVFVLDEPLAGLDRASQEWLFEFLLELKNAGKTLIISTHNDELAKTLTDRIIIMNENHKIVPEQS